MAKPKLIQKCTSHAPQVKRTSWLAVVLAPQICQCHGGVVQIPAWAATLHFPQSTAHTSLIGEFSPPWACSCTLPRNACCFSFPLLKFTSLYLNCASFLQRNE